MGNTLFSVRLKHPAFNTLILLILRSWNPTPKGIRLGWSIINRLPLSSWLVVAGCGSYSVTQVALVVIWVKIELIRCLQLGAAGRLSFSTTQRLVGLFKGSSIVGILSGIWIEFRRLCICWYIAELWLGIDNWKKGEKEKGIIAQRGILDSL